MLKQRVGTEGGENGAEAVRFVRGLGADGPRGDGAARRCAAQPALLCGRPRPAVVLCISEGRSAPRRAALCGPGSRRTVGRFVPGALIEISPFIAFCRVEGSFAWLYFSVSLVLLKHLLLFRVVMCWSTG